MLKRQKIRIDQYLLFLGLAESIQKAQALIIAGQILANDRPISKPGDLVYNDTLIRFRQKVRSYVSRAGEKLASAHAHFQFDVKDKIALDVGISTGGFTDFLLQNNAKTVIGVDVGYGQVAMKIQQNPNVVILERTNARTITPLQLKTKMQSVAPGKWEDAFQIQLVVMDLSFISVLSVLPNIANLVLPESEWVVMIKPQFEANSDEIESGGIVKNSTIRYSIIERVQKAILEQGFVILDSMDSKVSGSKGNIEHFLWLKKLF